MIPYPEEDFDSNVRFVINNTKNRKIIENNFDTPVYWMEKTMYIEIDLEKNEFYYSPDFWLYINKPPVISIEELLNDKLIYDRKKKLKQI